tara:strand:+ start:10180 stop:10956 length:777 start_codon:yes stop_codon:yes gene_type:complete
MYKSRKSSLEPVVISNWRWKPFLNTAINKLLPFSLSKYPISDQYLDKQIVLGSNKNPSIVTLSTWAGQSNQIKIARAACIEANNIGSIFNFVITPNPILDLPFLGADFVTLPTGHLIALDLQPAIKMDIQHTEKVWERLIPLYEKWSKLLPQGGPIPIDAKPYFSPGFLWTRLPLGPDGEEIISEVIQPAFIEYLNLFLDLLSNASEVSIERSLAISNGQKDYLKYRAAKDPARAMLNRFYGKEWTENYIHKVLFDSD